MTTLLLPAPSPPTTSSKLFSMYYAPSTTTIYLTITLTLMPTLNETLPLTLTLNMILTLTLTLGLKPESGHPSLHHHYCLLCTLSAPMRPLQYLLLPPLPTAQAVCFSALRSPAFLPPRRPSFSHHRLLPTWSTNHNILNLTQTSGNPNLRWATAKAWRCAGCTSANGSECPPEPHATSGLSM